MTWFGQADFIRIDTISQKYNFSCNHFFVPYVLLIDMFHEIRKK